MTEAAPQAQPKLTIISRGADRKHREPPVSMCILGPEKIGKTTLVTTLPSEETLFLDFEAGMLSIEDWDGDAIHVRELAAQLSATTPKPLHVWELTRALACVICGPDPSAPDKLRNGQPHPYGKAAYDLYCHFLFKPEDFAQYKTIFVDSITDAADHCQGWVKQQAEAYSEKTGNINEWAAQDLLAEEMVSWLKQWQHCRDRNIVIVGGLEISPDKDFPSRMNYRPMISGYKTPKRLPYIFDEIIVMGLFSNPDQNGRVVLDYANGVNRALACTKTNGFGLPAADRSGRLNALEPPDLSVIFDKVKRGKRQGAVSQRLDIPPQPSPSDTNGYTDNADAEVGNSDESVSDQSTT